MAKFEYKDGIAIKEMIAEKGGKISRRELADMLARHTGVMMPWHLKMYMQTMVSRGMLKTTEEGFEVVPDGN